jgi:hypothetical protein
MNQLESTDLTDIHQDIQLAQIHYSLFIKHTTDSSIRYNISFTDLQLHMRNTPSLPSLLKTYISTENVLFYKNEIESQAYNIKFSTTPIQAYHITRSFDRITSLKKLFPLDQNVSSSKLPIPLTDTHGFIGRIASSFFILTAQNFPLLNSMSPILPLQIESNGALTDTNSNKKIYSQALCKACVAQVRLSGKIDWKEEDCLDTTLKCMAPFIPSKNTVHNIGLIDGIPSSSHNQTLILWTSILVIVLAGIAIYKYQKRYSNKLKIVNSLQSNTNLNDNTYKYSSVNITPKKESKKIRRMKKKMEDPTVEKGIT